MVLYVHHPKPSRSYKIQDRIARTEVTVVMAAQMNPDTYG